MKNVNLKKRIMATVVSTAVAFGGAAVVAPAADADIRITSQYSQLSDDATQAAISYNKTRTLRQDGGQLQTAYGPGWCIDAALDEPQMHTSYQVRRLDGASGLYGFNPITGGNPKIDPELEQAAINVTKLMIDDYNANKMADAKKKNLVLQALVSNNQEILNQIRGYLKGEVKPGPYGFGWARKPAKVSYQEFVKWTGFEIQAQQRNVIGQSDYFLKKNSAAFSQMQKNVNPGEYVTVLVPTTYNLNQDMMSAKTNQRIIIVAQPGLDNYDPKVIREVITTTAKQPPVTTTKIVQAPDKTVTQTVTVRPTETVGTTVRPADKTVTVTTRPTVTLPQRVQPVLEKTVTETQPNVTVTETRRPDVTTVTDRTSWQRTTEMTTVTEPQRTITIEEEQPVVVTKTVTEQPTEIVEGATRTAYVTETAEPVTEYVRTTAAPRTEYKTVTATPETKVVETTVTSTNRQVVERTKTVERHRRHYSYALAFSGNDKSQSIEVPHLNNWRIEFVDDSDGLVKVEKVIKGGQEILEITPQREGRGDVRIVIVDNEGNRNEYVINVVNEKTEKVTVNDVTVNNHYFNVGVGNLDQTITVPAGWDYEVNGPGTLEKIAGSSNQYKVKLNDGLTQGKLEVKVFEKVNGKATGSENNYIFLVDTRSDRATQTRIIGNFNSYKLDIPGVEEEPQIVSGQDKIEKIEKRGDFWVITPKQGETGDVVIKAVDNTGKVFTYTLKIQPGTNVLVDVETHKINEGDSVEIRGGAGFTKEIVSQSGDWTWEDTANGWKVTNKVNGSLVVNVYAKDENAQGGRILVGTYTIVAGPIESNYETIKATHEVLDRNTITLKRGTAGNRFEIKEGTELFTYTEDEKGNWIVRPIPGTNGTIVISEIFNNVELIEHTIKVTEGAVEEKEKNEKSSAIVTVSGKIRVTEGEELLASSPQNGQLKFVDGANGRVVVEVLNSRDLPYQRYVFNITPGEPREESFTLTPKSESSISLNSSNFTFEVQGDDVLQVVRNNDTLNITPKKGATGTATVVIKDENGTVIERYTYTVVPGKGGDNTATSSTYKITTDGKFTITRLNNNPIQIVDGEQWVELKQDDNTWQLKPTGPDAAGKTVTVVETRGDVVVRRYTLEIVEQPEPLKFEEIRTILYKDIKDQIEYGPKETYNVIRGNDLVTVKETAKGKLEISANPGKSGFATIEIRDPQGNPVRVVEVTVPDALEGVPPAPQPSIVKNPDPNRPGTYLVDFKGGSNNVEINICTGDNSCSLVPASDLTELGDNKIVVDPRGKGDKIQVVPIDNGVYKLDEKIEIVIERGSETNGSSELDGACIASLVGLSAPLLLLIPVGILSQVQIPGLEGVSAQINQAIREANDYIQRGLGIYDRDRAERAARAQGAFQVANPEMIGLAAGSLGVILGGLLLVDTVLRNCGKEEASSSYQLGKATGSEFLINGSSGSDSKPSTSAQAGK